MKGNIYILTTQRNTVLYTGVTSDLKGRINNHKIKKYPNSFSARYNIDKLVYYKKFQTMAAAIRREKQIKAGSRQKKIDLINSMNPEWNDLSDNL